MRVYVHLLPDSIFMQPFARFLRWPGQNVSLANIYLGAKAEEKVQGFRNRDEPTASCGCT